MDYDKCKSRGFSLRPPPHTKFWPIVFHGAASCWLPDAAVDKLRTKMAWALRWTCAGAGPDLRALTEGSLLLDPAFYQLWTCFRDFRRFATLAGALAGFHGLLSGSWVCGSFFNGFASCRNTGMGFRRTSNLHRPPRPIA